MPASAPDAAFRAALGRFPTGVTVVSTVHDDVDHAITASAFTSVSLVPPRVLVCVDTRTRFHDPMMATGSWGVSILAEEGREAASWLATRGRPIEHQLDAVAHHRGPATGAALLDAALGWLECRTWRTYDGGDHTIVVGTVVAAAIAVGRDDPLLYYRSHYGSLIRQPVSEHGPDPLPVDPAPAAPELPVLEPGSGSGGG